MSEEDCTDVEVEMVPSRETEASWFFVAKDDKTKAAHFPKSQVSFTRRSVKTLDAIANIPDWLLNQRGW